MINPFSQYMKRANFILRFLLFGLLLFLLAGCASQPSGVPMNYRWASVEGGQIQETRAGEQFYFSIPVDEGMIAEGAPVSIKVSGAVTSGWLRFELRAPNSEPVWNSGTINPGDFSVSTKYSLPAGQVGDYTLGLVYGANTSATYNLGWRAFKLGPIILLPGLGMIAVGLAFIAYVARKRLTGWRYLGLGWMDPMMGIVGAILVGRWSWGLLRDSGKVLLDRQAPEQVIAAVHQSIETQTEARIADLHIWAIAPGLYACELCVTTSQDASPNHYKSLLPKNIGIVHATVEVHKV